jgi:hypothetical protein
MSMASVVAGLQRSEGTLSRIPELSSLSTQHGQRLMSGSLNGHMGRGLASVSANHNRSKSLNRYFSGGPQASNAGNAQLSSILRSPGVLGPEASTSQAKAGERITPSSTAAARVASQAARKSPQGPRNTLLVEACFPLLFGPFCFTGTFSAPHI